MFMGLSDKMDIYELWEVDVVTHKKLKKVDTIEDATIALNKAIELASKWCEGEVPEIIVVSPKHTLVIGESDYGIVVSKVKVK
jgi:hypothetical protein